MASIAADSRLPFLSHLRELRTRIMWSVIALLIAFPIAYFITDRFFYLFTSITPSVDLIYTEITEMLGTYFKVMLILAFVLALPFIVYQVILFIRPALTRNEKKYVYLLLPSVFLLFVVGAVFAYLVLLPPAMNFLLNFHTEIARPMIKIGNYISIVTNLVFWIGLCFELPLIMFLLAKVGILRAGMLNKFRKGAYLLAFVLGAIITPTFDPVNQTLVAAPIIVLYEIGTLLTWLAARGKKSNAY
jgi:sec-independent protein translocase protein TatC